MIKIKLIKTIGEVTVSENTFQFRRVLGLMIAYWGAAVFFHVEQQAAAESPTSVGRRIFASPKVDRYDSNKDKLYHISSTLNPPHEDIAADDPAFYGNRLKQYSFRGSRKQGGIYSSMSDHKKKLKLDPLNYRYRVK